MNSLFVKVASPKETTSLHDIMKLKVGFNKHIHFNVCAKETVFGSSQMCVGGGVDGAPIQAPNFHIYSS